MDNEENHYILYELIPSDFSDPISSLLITDDFVIIGTMLGKIILYSLYNKKLMRISEGNTENITSIKFDEIDNVLYAAKGDEEIFQIQILNKYKNIEIQFLPKVQIYSNEEEHEKNCENTVLLLSEENLLKLETKPPDEKVLDLNKYKANYEIKNFIKDKLICQGYIVMGNYSILFDFDGENFIFMEILGEDKRNICSVNLISNNKENNISIPIGNDFGHISYIKYISDLKVIVVHSLNLCEIRKLNKEFTIIESFKHRGDEVYDINLFYYSTKIESITEEINKHDKNNIKLGSEIIGHQSDINNQKKIKPLFCLKKIKDNSISIGTGVPNTITINKVKNKKIIEDKHNNNNNSLSIITLDIDGNVNCYNDKEEKTLFNLYDINDISIDIKNKSFFSMGYQYYIQTNNNFFCISTDYGCFIIKKKN